MVEVIKKLREIPQISVNEIGLSKSTLEMIGGMIVSTILVRIVYEKFGLAGFLVMALISLISLVMFRNIIVLGSFIGILTFGIAVI